jgi:hypothetical protein
MLELSNAQLEQSDIRSLGRDALGHRVYRSIIGLGYPQLTSISCESYGATIKLSGTLSSYYLVQVAQAIACKVPGVHRVVNEITVVDDIVAHSNS